MDHITQTMNRDYVPGSLKASYAYQAAKWMNDMRAFPSNTIPVDWREKALQQIEADGISLRKVSATGSQLAWQSVGPANVGGRIRSILIDPQHPETLYVGSVSGGIWKSTNGGTRWNPTADLADNMCIGTMVMDPTDPNIIYAGTGEGYFNIDALRGAGVLKSTNGGASWTLLTNFATPNSRYSYYYINKLVIRPDNPSVLYAAMIGGIWKTTNAGNSWTKLSTPNSSNFCMDLVASPTNPDIMYASFGLFMPDNDGIYKTIDGGDTWTKLTNGFPDKSLGYTRISLAIAPNDPSVVYASVADSFYYTMGIYKTTNSGASWLLTASGQPYDNALVPANTHLGGQGFYNNVIAVHPTNAGIIYAGGINVFKSTNSGTAWTRLINGNGAPNFHVDQHVIVFNPNNPQKMYFGNDGGVFRSTDGGATFTSLNNSLSVTQFYSGAVHPTQNIFYGGSQDNGTLMASNQPTWYQILAGDGGPVLVDYQNPNNVYMSYVYMTIYKSTNGGPSPIRSMNNIPNAPGQQWVSDRASFIAPMAMDPSNPQTLYAGSYRLYKTIDGAQNWTTFTSDLTGSGSSFYQTDGATITAISVAKSNPGVIYVGTSGWSGVHSRIMVTTNAGGTWLMANTSPLPNREVTGFAIDPFNANKTYATFSGYNVSTPATPGHVFVTTNHNGSWTNVSGNLPDVPVNVITIDPKQLNHLIAGTDLGVFESTNGGTTWSQQNTGMANVAVFDLDVRGDGYIVAATHGRGIFVSSSSLFSGLELHAPTDNASNLGSSVTFQWKHSDSTNAYRLMIGTDPSFTTGIFYNDSTLTDTMKTVSGLVQNKKYYWQISMRTLSGNVGASPIWSFSTNDLYSGMAFPTDNATNMARTITFRWLHSDSTSVYTLNVGRDPLITSTIFFSDSTLAETTKTLTGFLNTLTYYWQISFKKPSGRVATSPIRSFTIIGSYPTTYTLDGSVNFPTYVEQRSYSTSDYRLVGIPGDATLKADSMLSGTHQVDWQMFWDNGDASNYLIEFNGDSNFQFKAGRGFWLLNKGRWSVTATVPTLPLSTGGARIPLHSGWNIITDPYNFTVAWQSVLATNSLSEQLWGFEGSFSASSTMDPFKGYYFFNATNAPYIDIPYGNYVGKTSSMNRLTWSLGVSLTSNGFTDESALLGVSPSAKIGLDPLDSHRPRSVGDLPLISFERPEWDPQYHSFAMDVKPVFADSQSWKFQAHAKQGIRTTVSVTGIASIPSSLEVYLIDVDRGTTQNMRTNATYRYTPMKDDNEFEIVIGTAEALHERITNVTPRSYFLSDNYPNPFNPSTTFEYSLPVSSFVRFKIYTMVGQEIATLVSEQQHEGMYTISWNATDYPSGVYFAQLSAGTYTSVKKILLMK